MQRVDSFSPCAGLSYIAFARSHGVLISEVPLYRLSYIVFTNSCDCFGRV